MNEVISSSNTSDRF